MKTVDIIAAIIAVLILISIWKLQRDPTSSFNLIDLVMDNGRVSRIACVFLAAFAVYSWVMIKLVTDGKMTEGYLTAYGLTFVAPIIARLFSPAPAPGTMTTTSQIQTIEQTPAPPK